MKPNEPAFPTPSKDYPGVSVRIYIATHALQGLLSFRDYYGASYQAALDAFAMADALIEQEKKHEPTV